MSNVIFRYNPSNSIETLIDHINNDNNPTSLTAFQLNLLNRLQQYRLQTDAQLNSLSESKLNDIRKWRYLIYYIDYKLQTRKRKRTRSHS